MLPAALLVLGIIRSPCSALEASPTLSDESCEAAFNLVVPGELVRSQGKRGLAVVVNYADEDNLVRFDLKPASAAVTVRRNGKESIVARGKARRPVQTGTDIVLKRRPDRVALVYGGETIARGEAELPVGDQWGIVGADAGALDRVWYQPVADVVFTDDFMRGTDEESPWEPVAGEWTTQALREAEFSANAFSLAGTALDGPAVAAAGDWFWEDYTIEVSVYAPEEATGFGVGLCWSGDGVGPGDPTYERRGTASTHLHLLRFLRREGDWGKVQLVRVRGSREAVLAERSVPTSPGEWHRMAISATGEQLVGAVDGRELLSASDPGLAHGQIVLWVAGERAVSFDDVEAYSGPIRGRRPTVLAHAREAADPGAQQFIRDQYMEGWADESDQWQPAPGPSIWHAGYFWGDVELALEIDPSRLASALRLHICVPTDGPTMSPPPDPQPGYHLSLEPEDGGQLALRLSKGSEVRAEAAATRPDDTARLALRKRGPHVEAVLNGEAVAAFADDSPSGGGKVGISGATARRQAARLSVTSRNVIDSTFRSAPTEWAVVGGEWSVRSRWACTPRWSWFGGRAEHLAAIWTRESFGGDAVVEFFGGFLMDSPFAPFYDDPSDINVTLCGDGATPGSGYSFIYGGWRNRATAILRKGEVVAETPGFLLPDTLDSLGGELFGGNGAVELHKHWRHVRAERIGSTLRLIIDGKLALAYDDPDPLPGGPAAIWTLGNGLTVARARVYFERSELPPLPTEPTVSVSASPSVGLRVKQPPHIAETFEGGTRGWQPAEPDSCALALAETHGDSRDRCLSVTNLVAGGTFALKAPVEGIDVTTHPLLAFDYAIPDDVRIDVYPILAGRKYRLRLTGPEQATPGIEDLGPVPDALADGRWRHAEVDLLGLLRPYFPPTEPIVLEGLQFANYVPADYLMAGVGGNGAGASYCLDSFFLGRALSAPVRVVAPAQAQIVGRTQGSENAVQLRPTRQGPDALLAFRESGVLRLACGRGAPVDGEIVAFDQDPPVVQPVCPLPQQQWIGPWATFAIHDDGPAGIDEESLAVEFAGQRFAWPAGELDWDPLTGELSLSLRAAGIELSHAQSTPVRVAPVRDRAGNSAPPLQFEFIATPEADRAAPSPPALAGVPAPLCRCDFEQDSGCFRPWGTDSGAELRRTRNHPAANEAGHDWCLEVRNTRIGGPFGLEVGCVAFEASRGPVLEFDYCVPDTVRVDLLVDVAGSRRQIKFTDNDSTWPVVGKIDAVADGEWHRAVVDLYGLLRVAFSGRRSLPVTRLAFASTCWPGNPAGTAYWLDNFEIHSAIDLSKEDLAAAIASADETGLSAVSWLIDTLPGTTPPNAGTEADLAAALDGHRDQLIWLHASACDGAGNWSPPAHLPLRATRSTDSTPPMVADVKPAPGERAATRTITATVTDVGAGVSPADLRLSVDETTYTIADASLTFDEASGRLTWTAPGASAFGRDGDSVDCTLFARDLAGNDLDPPPSWEWRLDYSQDHEPPPPPVVSYWPSWRVAANDFERDTGTWGNFVSCQVLRRADGGATRPGCLELRDLRERGGTAYALICDLPSDWQRFPMIRFRYRVDQAGTGGSLALRGTTFDGLTDQWTPLASLPSGDGWQTACVNLADALRAADPRLTMHRVFLDCRIPNPDGAILIDDFVLYSAAGPEACFTWAPPPDASGLAGYSWVLDQQDGTMPDEVPEGDTPEAEFENLAPGHWCFHIRARDGAGNWGPPAHVPFDIAAAAATS
jgi:hypothetical protein